MCNERILGGEVANAIDIHKKTLHLTLHPVMMPILLLMKRNYNLLVIEHTSMLLRPLSYCAGCSISVGTMLQPKLTSKRTSRSRRIRHLNAFKWLSEALEGNIVFMNRLLGRLRIYVFIRHIHFRQKDNMVAL